MKKLISRRKFYISLLICFFALFLIYPAQAQSPVQFTDLPVENHFPDHVVFRAEAASSGGQIIAAELAYTAVNIYSPASYTVEEVEITPGAQVSLEYILDTSDFTNPPGMTYSYEWRVRLEDGSEIISQPVSFRYTDTRYDWQTRENDLIGVWWHDKSQAFGQAVFEIAAAAVAAQSALFQVELENQLLVVINNDPQEFASWHTIAYDWVGGETYSNYGLTVQIVSGENPEDSWLYGVIPHEISHIFFAQLTYNPTVSIPVWLNEGVAQYNEFVSQDWVLDQVASAAAQGDLIPLSDLDRGFGAHDTERVYLAYYESLSAVSYLVETYGSAGLSGLLAAYKDGISTEKAFQQALGVSATQFELDWAASLGAVDYQISTPLPLPTFPPSPTFGSPGAATPRPPASAEEKTRGPLLPCLGSTALLGFGLVGAWYQKERRVR